MLTEIYWLSVGVCLFDTWRIVRRIEDSNTRHENPIIVSIVGVFMSFVPFLNTFSALSIMFGEQNNTPKNPPHATV